MPLQMIGTTLDDVISFLKCSRRKQASPSKSKKRAGRKTTSDSDDASKSTEPGDHSVSEFSDWSDRTDKSYTERRKRRISASPYPVRDWSKARLGPPPGLSAGAPPGLEAPPGLSGGSLQDLLWPQGCQGTRLNSQAKVFVPSFAGAAPETSSSHNSGQLRQSIRMLKESLEQLEASAFADQQLAHAPAESQTMLALREALDNLTPQDAATVKAFLDNKTANSPAPNMQMAAHAPMGYGNLDPNLFSHFGLPLPPGHLYKNASLAQSGGQWPSADAQQGQQHAVRPRGERNSRVAKTAPQIKPADNEPAESLSTHLRDLSMLDNSRVIMVRKINHLGMDPSAALEAHFSQFGSVDRIMVSANRSKSARGTSSRLRPATVGFMVFGDASAVDAALAYGEEHSVQGVSVIVSRFQSHDIDEKK